MTDHAPDAASRRRHCPAALIAALLLPAAGQAQEEGLWALCRPLTVPPLIGLAESGVKKDPAEQTTQITADRATAEVDALTTFSGDVLVERGDRLLRSDTAEYDKRADIVTLTGSVQLRAPDLALEGEQARVSLGDERGWVREAAFRLPREHAWGTAEQVEIIGPRRLRLKQAFYTTCDPQDIEWQLRAQRLQLDQATNTGEAYHTSLWFKGVPILYLPYLNFPLKGRKTGFLAPSVGGSEVNGTDIALPYYWNIAPNRDATTTVRYLENRGTLLHGEFRYLNANSAGQADLEYLPSDALFGDDRSRVAIRHQARPAPRWSAHVVYNSVSDDQYFNDLSDSLSAVSLTHLERRASLRYQGDNWSLEGLVLDYQTLEGAPPDYKKLPQITLTADSPTAAPGPAYDLRLGAARFEHEALTPVGSRLDVRPGITFPLEGDAWFLRPRAAFRHTSYSLDQTTGDETISRDVPLASIDGGLFFERDLELGGRRLLQTLEPRLYYLYVPFVDQSDIPDFDSASYTFSFAQLFRENRFSGADRVGDANQISAALNTRLLDADNGREYLSAGIGQIYYFDDRRVTLSAADPIETESRSDLIGEASATLANLSATGTVQWDPFEDRTTRASYRLTYQTGPRRIISAAFISKHEEAALERQSDVAILWPLSPRWHFIGRWYYDAVAERSLQTVLGVEYENCCWSIRIVGQDRPFEREDPVSGVTIDDTERSFAITLNLKGLGEIGRKLEDALEEGVLGFRKTQ